MLPRSIFMNSLAEFQRAARQIASGRAPGSLMFYQFYEMNHAVIQPLRAVADATRLLYSHPMNPWSATPVGRSIAGLAEIFERTTRRYGKPAFDLPSTVVDWKHVSVTEDLPPLGREEKVTSTPLRRRGRG